MRAQKLIFLFSVLVPLSIFWIFSFSPSARANSPTIITEDITTNTMWTVDQSPYVVESDIVIAPGATLIIDPGVIIKFDGGVLGVFGTIKANGVAGNPVAFTSFKNDIGGDTNNSGYDDEEGHHDDSIPASGDWGGIYLNDTTGASSFSYTDFSYEGNIFVDSNPAFSANNINISNAGVGIEMMQTTATLSFINENNLSPGFSSDGLVIFNNSTVTLDNFIHRNGGNGIDVFSNSSLTLTNATISDISGYAIEVFNTSTLTVMNANISNISRQGLQIFQNSTLNATAVIIDRVLEEALMVFSDSTATFDNGAVTHNQNFSFSGAVKVFNNSSLAATDSNFDTGLGDGIDIFDNAKLTLTHSAVKNFIGSGIADFGNNQNSNHNLIAIKDSIITGNDVGIDIYNNHEPYPDLNITNNSIASNFSFGARTFGHVLTLPFGNNWWGDKTGPANATSNLDGLGNAVSDFISFAPLCKAEGCIVRNPVIIVPGVLGTEIFKPDSGKVEQLWLDWAHNLISPNDNFMDSLQFNSSLEPIAANLIVGDVIKKVTATFQESLIPVYDYTGSLVNELINQGYIEGVDLFLFPYDWRYGVREDIVTQLKQKISNVLATSGADKVDIIAHSTGGLIVKKYVIENPDNNYVNKAVFIGVPNTGAPKAIKALVSGDDFGNFLVAENEMKKISQNMPVAYDLSPSEEYFNVKGSYVRILDVFPLHIHPDIKDLNFDEANNFLFDEGRELNAQALINAHHLHTADFDNYDLRTAGVNLYAIDGCKAGTIGKFVEARNHGFIDKSINYLAPEETPGDGTVPLESSTNLPIDSGNKFYALKGTHGEMLSANGVRQQIVNIISGSSLSTEDSKGQDIITQDISKCSLNGRALAIYSPLSIDITDQDGNHSGFSSDGVSTENHIPNADFEIIGGHKFVYLPTDGRQTYTINLSGTGTGTFTLTDASINVNNITSMQVFKNISVTPSLLGHLNIADNTTLSLDTNGDGIIDQTLSPNVLLNAEDAQNFVPDFEETGDIPNNNISKTHSSGGGGAYLPVASLPVALKTQKVESEDNPKIVVPKSKTEIEQVLQLQNAPKDSILTANVVDTGTQINYKILITVFSGMLVILLVAKKFIKV